MPSRTVLLSLIALVLGLASATAQVADGFDEYGGLLGTRRAATGHFRVGRADGRWSLIDPDGYLFISVGITEASLRPHGSPRANPYRRAALARHGSEPAWADATVERLRHWGFNTLGAGADAILRRRAMPYTITLSLAHALSPRDPLAFPDVFDPRFERAVQRHARRVCRPHAESRWLVGYFTDGPLHWGPADDDHRNLLILFLGLDDYVPGRRAALTHLTQQYANLIELNEAWSTTYRSFEEIGRIPQVGSRIPQRDIDDFQRLVATRYFRIARDAIRAADRRHLILGPWFDGEPPVPVLEALVGMVDVISLVDAEGESPVERLDLVQRVTDRPALIAAVGFGPAFPLRHRREAGEHEERERAERYRQYLTELLALPMVVGCHWHPYVDAPPTGPRAGFSAGGGLVDADDEPYALLVEGVRSVNRNVYRLAGHQPAEMARARRRQADAVVPRGRRDAPGHHTPPGVGGRAARLASATRRVRFSHMPRSLVRPTLN